MAETNKDAQMHHSATNGDMTSIDLTGISAAIQAMQQDMQSAAKSIQDEWIAAIRAITAEAAKATSFTVTSSSEPGPSGWNGGGTSAPSGGDHPGIGMPEYGASVANPAAITVEEVKTQSRPIYESERKKSRASTESMQQTVMDNDVANAVKATNVAKRQTADEEAASAAQRMAIETTVATSALALFGAAAKVAIDTMHRSQAMAAADRNIEVVDVTSRAEMRVRNAQAESHALHSAERATVDYSKFNGLRNLKDDRKNEAELRTIESRTDITPERKAEIRRQTEQSSGFEQRHDSLQLERGDIQKREGLLNTAQTAAEKQKATIVSARDSSLGVIKSKRKEIAANPAVFGFHTKDQHREADSLENQYQQQKLKSASELKQADEEIQSIRTQKMALAERKVGVNEQSLKVTRQQKQNAYENVRDHQEGMRQDSVSIGMQGHGDRARIKMVDQTISRIRDQKRRKAGGEDVKVETLQPWMMGIAKSNRLGLDIVDEQAIENEKSMKLENKERSEDQLKEKKDHLAKLEASPQEKKDEDNLGGSLDAVREASANAMKSIESVLEITKIVNGLDAALKQVETELKARESKRGGILTPWL